MVDTHALGACAARRGGSTPFIRTIFEYELMVSTKFGTTILYHYKYEKKLSCSKYKLSIIERSLQPH